MLFHTSEAHFDEVLAESRERPVLVDFYAGWCAPCRALEPELDALTDAFEDVVSAYSVNTDTDPTLAARYGIDKLPAVLLLHDGVVQRWENDVKIQDIKECLEQLKGETHGSE